MAELDAEVVERLEEYVGEFVADFGLITRRYWAGVYLQGLLLDGERKSIEPLSRRVSVPGWHGDTEQALQQFVNQSVWDHQAVLRTYRLRLAQAFADPDGVIVIDDTGFAKKGRHSVGVARQYSGTLGKTDNCQVAVSLHYAAPKGDYPLALRLFLPESWTNQPERMQAVRVPTAEQVPQTKGEIALKLLDQVRDEGLAHRGVVVDAGYGISVEFRRGLEERGESYAVGVAGQEAVFGAPPTWAVRSQTTDEVAHQPAGTSRLRRRPQSPSSTCGDPRTHTLQLAPGHQGTLAGRVRVAAGVASASVAARTTCRRRAQCGGRDALAAGRMAERWLDPLRAVQFASHGDAGGRGRFVENPLASGAGLSTTQGGTWAGPLRGALLARLPSPRCLCFLAYGFLALERARGTATRVADLDETDDPFAHRHPTSPRAAITAD